MELFCFLCEKAFVEIGRIEEELGFINLPLLQYGKEKLFQFRLIKPLWILTEFLGQTVLPVCLQILCFFGRSAGATAG